MTLRLIVRILLFWSVPFASVCTPVSFGDEQPAVVLKYEIDPDGYFADKEVDIVDALGKRVGRDGKVTALDNQHIQVELFGNVNQAKLDSIKRRITDLGHLEFRILASLLHAKDRLIIQLAKRLQPDEKVVEIDGKRVAEWVSYAVDEFGPVDQEDEAVIKRLAGDVPEALVLIDAINLTGLSISSATKGLDERGAASILLSFDREGARRMRSMTTQNKPDPANPGVYRHLGIILDKKLLSAPRIITTISDRAMISGGSMTERDVDHVTDILNAGSLPRAVRLVEETRTGN